MASYSTSIGIMDLESCQRAHLRFLDIKEATTGSAMCKYSLLEISDVLDVVRSGMNAGEQ